jgi:hypothetical protein
MCKRKTTTRARTCERTTRSMPRFLAYPGPTARACGGRTGLDPPRACLACEDDGPALPPKTRTKTLHGQIWKQMHVVKKDSELIKSVEQDVAVRSCRLKLPYAFLFRSRLCLPPSMHQWQRCRLQQNIFLVAGQSPPTPRRMLRTKKCLSLLPSGRE